MYRDRIFFLNKHISRMHTVLGIFMAYGRPKNQKNNSQPYSQESIL